MIDILRVDESTVAQNNADLGFEHRQIEKFRNALQVFVTHRTQGQVRPGIIINKIIIYKLRGYLRSHIGVINMGLSRFDNIYNRLDITGADAADLHHCGLDI